MLGTDRGKQKYSRKICVNAAWSTTSPTRTAWGYNVRNFCGERFATDLLRHGEAKNLRFGYVTHRKTRGSE